MNEMSLKTSDHDLLIEIHTTLKRAVQDIRDLKDGLDSRVGLLEENKADKNEIEDIITILRGADGEGGLIKKAQENRDSIKSIWKIIAIYSSVLTPIIGFIIYLLINHILGKS